ncbi:hypothetical protein ILFOPFJJ_05694 [Ensifer psoraleae]|uniref:hypothetical protein n=1 Tax=Sinorhizobium psoraleae TaxID=520838 RepID=UPI001569A28E|nr:hypothetical protein [Sinorhizobium psoraleae]NRP74772.1 hypothetical protein [Sinorhizobium psoraleae]
MRPSPGELLDPCVVWTCLLTWSAIVSGLAEATVLTLVSLAALLVAVNRIPEDAADPDAITALVFAPEH